MGWAHDITVRGIRYTQGSRIYLQSNAPAYTSCDKTSAATTYYTTDSVWFYGRFDAAYSRHPYCVSRRRAGQPDYYIDEAHFPYLTSTVYFHANGGSGAPGAQTKVWGTVLTLSSTRPTRTGYTFLGWSTSSTATSATYGAGGQYGADVSVTLYAVWRINKYRVTYDANEGSCATAYTDCNYNSYATHPTPTRAGYTFEGWYTAAVGGTRHLGGSNRITGNITLYAHWTINQYNLYINTNGGVYNGEEGTITIVHDYNASVNITEPTRVGYVFAGWSSSGVIDVSHVDEGYVIVRMDATLTALWAKQEYNLRIDANSGTYEGSGSMDTSILFGTVLILSTPVREGYTFMGWTVHGLATLEGNQLTIGASDTVLIANWTIKSYVVTFDGTTNGGVENIPQGYNHGDRLSTLPHVHKQYYDLVGWFTAPDDSGEQVTEDYIVTSDVTLYAHYVLVTTLAVCSGGVYNPAVPYIYFEGEWHQGITYVYVNGEWQQGIGGA